MPLDEAGSAVYAGGKLGERLKVLESDPHRRERVHLFDHGKYSADEVPILPSAGREREAAIPAYDSRDAMQRRGCRPRVEGNLRVVVGMDVDNSGSNDLPARIDFPIGADFRQVPQCSDPYLH